MFLIYSCFLIVNCFPQFLATILEDRVAFLVTGKNLQHLFGVPVVLKDTSEQMAKIVIREVYLFELRDEIVGISFDILQLLIRE